MICGIDRSFLKCQKKFPDNTGLEKKTVGPLSQVSTVKDLRPRLMTEKFIVSILKVADGMDRTNFGALEIIANMLRDGKDGWLLTKPSSIFVVRNFELAQNCIIL